MKHIRKYSQFFLRESEDNYKPGSILDRNADKGKEGIPSGTIIGNPDTSKSLKELEREGNYKPGSILDRNADKGKESIPSGTIIGNPDKSKSLEELEKEGNYKPASYLD